MATAPANCGHKFATGTPRASPRWSATDPDTPRRAMVRRGQHDKISFGAYERIACLVGALRDISNVYSARRSSVRPPTRQLQNSVAVRRLSAMRQTATKAMRGTRSHWTSVRDNLFPRVAHERVNGHRLRKQLLIGLDIQINQLLKVGAGIANVNNFQINLVREYR